MTNNAKKTKKIKIKKMLTAMTWLLMVGGLTATLAMWLFAKPVVLTAHTIPTGFSVQGVAVNQTSGYVDYSNLASNGIDYVYLRATTGTNFVDDSYESSYNRARSAQLKVGSIQVYDANVDASTQAQYFIDNVGNRVGQLPIAFYVTDNQIDTQASIDRLATLIQILKTHYNRSTVIYTTPSVKNKLKSTISDTKYWLIDTSTTNKSNANQFIQYSEDHTIGNGLKAIKMPTSVFNGTEKEFEDIK
ncbi:GH25 family lysozyme [uncultured Leuconostoc sp.]|uniref:GH25 family lysozyme n=1 Tax=uncultured Leuconostoc sp. TaxID=173262 RepID=UPI0025F4A00A|nr:GH25 family lysozyme [uncultured Leuconostoc sp.]